MITKEEFVNYIDILQKHYDVLNKLCDNIPHLNIWESFPIIPKVEENYVDMLAKLVNAPTYDLFGYKNDVELFVYAYDFGRNVVAEDCKDENGEIIDFTSAAAVYDAIQSSKK